ncbi:hypothetical protein AVEN_52021-1 [Araneus ventricosus]|uniref:Uncharacterized protein n=1 Tax=Araneus ventricosus TaxID=182803 RepID=A0A4Y2CEI4_ARAVE|nr:hypothetical protein AVEN_52021-1 [Araneus ventricosus]
MPSRKRNPSYLVLIHELMVPQSYPVLSKHAVNLGTDRAKTAPTREPRGQANLPPGHNNTPRQSPSALTTQPNTPSSPLSGRTGSIFTNPTLIELRQEISQYHWLRGAVTSFSVLARSVRQS